MRFIWLVFFSAFALNVLAQQVDTAFVLQEKDLITEGIAYSKSMKTFFVGSIYKRKIISVAPDGQTKDLFAASSYGVKSVAGIKVDDSNKAVWAVSGAFYFKDKEPWNTAIFKFDAKTGALLGKYPLADTLAGFNDLSLHKNGAVYITDTGQGAIYVKQPKADNIEIYLPKGTFSFPNGIAIMGDTLFVADSNGIWGIPFKTKKPYRLEGPADVELGGIDGLSVYKNNFIAVQNGVTPRRVIQIRLNEARTKAEEVKILDMHDADRRYYSPTTGVVVGDDFYFLSNSQVRSFDANRKIFPMDKLEPIYIKRIRLK